MSTRRSTRATSRQASEAGASPAPSTAATPRRRRPANAPLPAVGTRTSTAYGTNTVAQPSRAAGPQISNQVIDVLQGIIQNHDTASNAATSRVGRGRGASQTPAGRGGRGGKATPTPSTADRSFRQESKIFGDAEVESSVASPSNLNHIPEEQESSDSEQSSPADNDQKIENTRRQRLEDVARQQRIQRQQVEEERGAFISDLVSKAKDFSSSVFQYAFETIKAYPLITAMLLFLVLAFITQAQYSDESSSMFNIRNNIDQFLLGDRTYSNGFFRTDEFQDLQSRMKRVEREIAHLRKRHNLHDKTVTKLEGMLPENILVKKDWMGNIILPDDLWHAIRDKIRADQDIVLEHDEKISNNKPSSKTDISIRDIEKIASETAGKTWDRFIRTNDAKIQAWATEEIDSRFRDNILSPRSEIINFIKRNWEENSKEINKELKILSAQWEQTAKQVSALQHHPSGHAKEEWQAIATEVLKKMMPHAQLEALAKSNLKINVDYSKANINHMSPQTGAVVNPQLTSPNYIFPAMDIWWFERTFRGLFQNPLPTPSPPIEALTKWDEHGDCWCAPAGDSEAFGASLGVIMGSSIYPGQVVVEHIQSTATLEPGAAPRDMELLAYIPDSDIYDAVKALSDRVFDNEQVSETPYRYVRIARWTYDLEALDNVQVFEAQLDMRGLGAHTNKVVVRALNNWGDGSVPYTCMYRVKLHGEVVVRPGLY